MTSPGNRGDWFGLSLDNSGIAPVIVPFVGYCVNRFCSELVIFGTAGMLITFGVTIPWSVAIAGDP